jgi:sucrose porin
MATSLITPGPLNLPPGITSLTDRLSLAPLIVAQSSNNRYLDSDHYDWLTLNARLIQEMNQNFALQYEASYQYMDIDERV